VIVAFSKGISKDPVVAELVALKGTIGVQEKTVARVCVVGWGCKANTWKAILFANREGLPFLRLEDGFLRSYGVGSNCQRLSLIVDDLGIYYDCTQPSALESLLQSDRDMLAGTRAHVIRARSLILGIRPANTS